jgi:hypothetical protein
MDDLPRTEGQTGSRARTKGGTHLFNTASAENNGKKCDDRNENKKKYLFD